MRMFRKDIAWLLLIALVYSLIPSISLQAAEEASWTKGNESSGSFKDNVDKIDYVMIQAPNGKYLSVNQNSGEVAATATSAGDYEKFVVLQCSDGTYALRSVMTRKIFGVEITIDQNTKTVYYHLDADTDFVEDKSKIKLNLDDTEYASQSFFPSLLNIAAMSSVSQSDGSLTTPIYFTKYPYSALACTDDGELYLCRSDRASSFTIHYYLDDTDRSILYTNEWGNLDDSNPVRGYWDIQNEIGGRSVSSLKEMNYTLLTQSGKNINYIEIDNMQASAGYKKKSDGTYEVIVCFQGTDGDLADLDSNLGKSITYDSSNGYHSGYYSMMKKLVNNRTKLSGSTTEKLVCTDITLEELIRMAEKGEAHFTILGHSMGGAIAQCFAGYLHSRGIPKCKISGRTFNSALAVISDDDEYTDWYNLCVDSDSVPNGLVIGSLLESYSNPGLGHVNFRQGYGMHRIGQTIWLKDKEADVVPDLSGITTKIGNISNAKHIMTAKIKEILSQTVCQADDIEQSYTVRPSSNDYYVTLLDKLESNVKPYASSGSVTQFPNHGTILDIRQYTRNKYGNMWYNLADGSWIYGPHVGKYSAHSMEVTYYAAGNSVPVRDAFYKTGNVLTRLSYHDAVHVTGCILNSYKNIWYRVKVNGVEGWIYTDNLFAIVNTPKRKSIFKCPVDITVKDSNGTIIASIANNTIIANNDESKVVPVIEGEIKSFYLMDDAEYTFEITATGVGSLTYTVQSDYDTEIGEFTKSKTFNSVVLEEGKQMYSEVGGEIDTPEVQLFVLNDEGTRIGEVQEDGSEVPIGLTVSFEMNGIGTQIKPQRGLENGAKVIKPADPDPTSEDWNFDGWYRNADFSTPWNYDTDTATEDITLYAKWSNHHQHSLTHHDASEANCAEEGVIEHWSCAKCGRFFADENATTELTNIHTNLDSENHVGITEIHDEIEATTWEEGYSGDVYCAGCHKLLENGTITHFGHSVIFVLNDHGNYEESSLTEWGYSSGEKLYDWSPYEEGWTFDGWFKEETLETPWDFDKDTITGDLVLYAKWTKKHIHTLTYHDYIYPTCVRDGNNSYWACEGADGCGKYFKNQDATIEIENVDVLIVPKDPTDPYAHVGETVIRNQKDATCVDEGYTGDTYCLDCNTLLSYGEAIPPTGEHLYTDDKDDTCNICGATRVLPDPESQPEDPVYTLTYELNGHGSEITMLENLPYGTKISGPDDPYDDEWDFVGWFKDRTLETPWDFEEDIITEDTTLYAKWTEKHIHHLTHHDSISATCIAQGLKDYWSCDGCKEIFADENAANKILDRNELVVPVDKNNHQGNTENRNAKAASCTETGYTGDTYCLACNEKLTSGEELPILPHTYTDDSDDTCNVCQAKRELPKADEPGKTDNPSKTDEPGKTDEASKTHEPGKTYESTGSNDSKVIDASDNSASTTVQTGDTNSLILWILFMSSAFTCVLVTLKRKSK